MHTFKLGGLLLIALVTVVAGQDLEGSGQPDGEAVTPSLTDDYVNCPPGDAEKNMMGEVEEVSQAGDYDDYYDDTFLVPKVSTEDENYTVENGTIVVVEEDSLTTVTVGDGGDEGEVVGVMEDVVDDDDEVEESIEDVGLEQSDGSDEDLLNDYPVKLIKTSKIYSVADTETSEVKFAAYKKEHSEEVEVVSPGFPQSYPDNLDEGYEEFNVTDGIGVQITIHELDLDPTSDFLHIRGGSANDTDEKGPIFTGKIDQPLRFLIAHTTTFSVRFVSQHEEGSEPNKHRGFRLTYAAFGNVVVPTTTTTTEPPVPQEEYQWIRKEISVSRTMMLSLDTWPKVRSELANATNMYVQEHQLSYKPCRPEDIRILAQKCPDTWPNYEECVTLRFAVPLRPEPVEEDQSPQGFGGLGKSYISVSTTVAPKPDYQLSEANLERMWNDYGAMALAQIGIEVYKMPENSQVLLIWIAISLCIVAAFIFVLYSIWKIDFFKDYRRISKMNREQPDDDRNQLKKKEFDISMFPSPHQIVPSFFPTGDPYNDRTADSQYAYDNSTMNPFAEEGFESRPSPKIARPKQPFFEPLSPTDYSPSIVDFNELPEPRSPRRSRTNPFLPPPANDGFNQAGPRPRP